MKKILLFAAAAALFAACASDELQTQTQQQTAQDDGAITFDAYLQRATTRAGKTGVMNAAGLQAGDGGFGVFAYYTDNFDYTPLYTPNFMYNEKVYYSGGIYKYDLTKYWPNEHGSAAQSADQDRVSFFAYAPYVEVDPSTGMLAKNEAVLDATDNELQWGITGMKRNTLQGDPIIQYISSFDQSESVDLCWATTGAADVTWNTNSSSQTIKAGYPWLNVRKPDGVAGDGAKVKFNFQHATSQLNVTVKTDFTEKWTETDATQTKVWIRSIRFTGIARKAALNLNNPKTLTANKARWIDYYGTNEMELGESVTVHDGRKDGAENVEGAVAPNELVLGINPNLIQDEKQLKAAAWNTGDGTRPGVTSTAVNLFCNGDAPATGPINVIPTGEKVTVEIVYDVETIDKKLPTQLSDGVTPGSTIENKITKTLTSIAKFENGKAYTINLILGLKDVMFDATETPWVEVAAVEDVNLPNNAPEFASVTNSDKYTVTVPASTTKYVFAVTGLKPGESVTGNVDTHTDDKVTAVSLNSKADGSGLSGVANASGVVYATATITANTDVNNINNPDAITITGGSSLRKAVFNITQSAHTLDLEIESVGDNAINLKRKGDLALANAANWNTSGYSITVLKNGVAMTAGDGAGQYQYPATSPAATTAKAAISLVTDIEPGEIYTITIKTGDAPAETVVAKIGGIKFVPNTRSIEYGYVGYNPTPTYYGATPSGYTDVDSTTPTTANITSTTDPTIKSTAVNNGDPTTISMKATQADGNGFYYTDATRKASYVLTVTKAAGVLIYNNDGKSGAPVTSGAYISTFPAVLQNSHGDVLTSGGTVTYSIVPGSVKKGDEKVVDETFKLTSSTGALDVGAANLESGKTYTLELKATVTGNENVDYATNEAVATITITTP